MDGRRSPATLPFAPPPPEFEDLLEGENYQAVSAVRRMLGGDAGASSVYVWGRRGCGKTHLLRTAAANMRREKRAAFYAGGGEEIPPPMPGLLAADDIGDMAGEARLFFFDWQNKLKPDDPRYAILAAGGAPPVQTGIGEEIAARLSAGLVFQLREITEAEKRRALEKYARRRGFALPESVSGMFLARLPRDMTSLIAALADLDNFLLARQKPLTMPLARKWLQSRPPPFFGGE
ncbi:MAG: HdaA/DnaA family protein [Gammaproteobacteria bacterium]